MVNAPLPEPLVHAIAYALPPETTGFVAGYIPRLTAGAAGCITGAALGKSAGLAPGFLPVTPSVYPPSKKRLLAAIAGRVIAHGTTIGLAEA